MTEFQAKQAIETQITVFSFLMQFYLFPEELQHAWLETTAIAFIEAMLISFSRFCHDTNKKNSQLLTYEDSYADLFKNTTGGPLPKATAENLNWKTVTEKMNDTFMTPIFVYFTTNADCFGPQATSFLIALSHAFLGYAPRSGEAVFQGRFESKDWSKLTDTDSHRSPSVLMNLLNFLSVLQNLSPAQDSLRLLISKIKTHAFNENMYEVASLSSCVVADFEVENQFDI